MSFSGCSSSAFQLFESLASVAPSTTLWSAPQLIGSTWRATTAPVASNLGREGDGRMDEEGTWHGLRSVLPACSVGRRTASVPAPGELLDAADGDDGDLGGVDERAGVEPADGPCVRKGGAGEAEEERAGSEGGTKERSCVRSEWVANGGEAGETRVISLTDV